MHTPKHEPLSQEFDILLTDEERDLLSRPDIPDDVRTEIFEALERRRDADRPEI